MILFDRVDALLEGRRQTIADLLRAWLPREFPSHVRCVVTSSIRRVGVCPESERTPRYIAFDHRLLGVLQDKRLLLQLRNDSGRLRSSENSKVSHCSLFSSGRGASPDAKVFCLWQTQSELADILLKFAQFPGQREPPEKSGASGDFSEKQFLARFILPKLARSLRCVRPLQALESTRDWLLGQFDDLCPETVTVGKLRELLQLLRLSPYGLTQHDLYRLLQIRRPLVDCALEHLGPLLVKTADRYRLKCAFADSVEWCPRNALRDRLTGLVSSQNSRPGLCTAAELYTETGCYFDLKRTLSGIGNFVVLFDCASKHCFFGWVAA